MKKLNEADVIKLLRKRFGKDQVHRLTGLRIRGIPDVLISINGTAFFLEIKIGDEKLTNLQKLFINIFQRSSGVIYIKNPEKDLDYEYIGPKRFVEVTQALEKK